MLVAGRDIYSSLKNICVWDKSTGGMGSLYRSQHEFIFVFKKGIKPHINNVELGVHGRYRTNVWKYKGMHASNPQAKTLIKLHPTVKPVPMIMDALLDCSSMYIFQISFAINKLNEMNKQIINNPFVQLYIYL